MNYPKAKLTFTKPRLNIQKAPKESLLSLPRATKVAMANLILIFHLASSATGLSMAKILKEIPPTTAVDKATTAPSMAPPPPSANPGRL